MKLRRESGTTPSAPRSSSLAPKLLSEPPVRQALALLLVALTLACLGALQVYLGQHAGGLLAAGASAGTPEAIVDTVPVLRSGLMEVMARIRDGVEAVGRNPHAFPRSADMLVLLGSLAFVLPAMSRLGLRSFVLANLVLGIVIGPSGLRIFAPTGWSQTLARVGVLFFLCEMGLQLNLDRLKKNWRDVFVVGLAQLILCTAALSTVARYMVGMSWLQALIAGGAFSLSSSAFVLQILGEQKERGTRHGRTAFSILLMQDLFVPLLLILLPMLNTVSGNSPQALPIIRQALIRTFLALTIAVVNGKLLLDWLFSFVASAGSAVALRSLCFCTIFGICFIFEQFGLPGTLGAFLAGVLLSETAYRQQVRAVIAPVREDFFGLFFITVGFSMDLQLVLSHPILVASTLSTLLLTKSLLTMLVCRASGLSWATSTQTGLLLSQAGEFTFVIAGTAYGLGMITRPQYHLLATTVGLSLALTPLLANVGKSLAEHMVKQQATEDSQLPSMPSKGTAVEVVIYGYGQIGKMISEVLDVRLVRWRAFDIQPRLVMEARQKDLPLYYGGPEQMLTPDSLQRGEGTSAASGAHMLIVTVASKECRDVAVKAKQQNPDLQVLACVSDVTQAVKLEQQGVTPLMPALPKDSMLMNMRIGVEVLGKLGYTEEEIGPIVKEKRLELIRQEDTRQQLLSKAGLQQAGIPADLGTIARWMQEGSDKKP